LSERSSGCSRDSAPIPKQVFDRGSAPALRFAKRCASPRRRRSRRRDRRGRGPALPDRRSRRSACSRPDPRRLASAPGSRSRGGAAPVPTPASLLRWRISMSLATAFAPAARELWKSSQASGGSERSRGSPTAGQAALRAVAPEAGPFVTSVQVEYQRGAPACSWPTAPARGMCASSWRRTQLIGRVLVLVHHGGSAAPSGAELASSWSSSHSKSTITSALRFSLAVTGRRPAASRVGAALFSGLDGTIAASGDGS